MKEFFELLLFPEERHERSPDPGPYTAYSSYKPHLQKEFRKKCVYCRTSDGLNPRSEFHVDHYLPQSQFPHLVCAWPNLFYSCPDCNRRKSGSVSTSERFLPNPCDHKMAEHLQYRDAEVETYSKPGEWLAELMRLNTEDRKDHRRFILSSLGNFLKTQEDLRGLLNTCETRLQQGDGDPEALEAGIQQLKGKLAQLERNIERLTGEPVSSVSTDPSRP